MVTTFYEDAETLVLESLEALKLLQPGLQLDKDQKTVWRSDRDPAHVSLLSGGGAGHEPAHAGFVGRGMLTAAVSGWVFASPSVKQIVSGISRIASSSGVLLIIKNYTGDIFHFHLAAEKARVSLGIPVEVLVVGDDVAVGRKKSGKVGRRGLAGTVLVHKILGARSTEPGVSLSEILALGKQVADNLVTVGASLEHVQVPGRTRPAEASNDQVEVGMGIHNETGSQVLKPRPSLRSLIDLMLNQLLDPNDNDRSYVDFSNAEQVILLVNNLGGLSEIEIGGITLNVVKQLALRHILPARVLSGTYMTSLNGLGFSITLLKATTSMLQYIDAPTDTRGWTKAVVPHEPVDDTQPVATSASGVEASAATRLEDGQPLYNRDIIKAAVETACEALIAAEPLITDYDSQVGDGDCGVTLVRGVKAVLAHVAGSREDGNAAWSMLSIAETIESNMDGTSGAVYGIFFTALAAALQTSKEASSPSALWQGAAASALGKLQQATPARRGDRTIMDALEPFVAALAEDCSVKNAVARAKDGMEATKGMRPAFGRAVYVEESAWDRVPDPGAYGVVCVLEAIRDAVLNKQV